MVTETKRVYQTITGRRIALSNVSKTENSFLALVAKKYNGRQEWTRFAAWWNAEFNATGLSTTSVVYRVCQDLEARLGISQGKVSPPDYRDYVADLIDSQFGSRQEFCKATEVDPGQLSRVLAGRSDLSIKVLQKILDVLHVSLVIQAEEEAREQTSVARAMESLAAAAVPEAHHGVGQTALVAKEVCPGAVAK
jgi:transcriptional regulator with XRE-family HTH domain